MGEGGSEGTPDRPRDRVGSRHSLRPPLLPLLPSPVEGRGCQGRASPGAWELAKDPAPATPLRRGSPAPGLGLGGLPPLHPPPLRQLLQPPAEVRLHLLSPEGEREGCLLLGCEREKVRDHLAGWARAPRAGSGRVGWLRQEPTEVGEMLTSPYPHPYPCGF